jgi:hypothetical protein
MTRQATRSKMTFGTYSSSRVMSPNLRNENMIGVTDLNILANRMRTLRKRVENQEKMDWATYDRDCLENMKLRIYKNIKSVKTKISFLMMEFEAAEKIDIDAKRAGFKKDALDKTNQNVSQSLLIFNRA